MIRLFIMLLCLALSAPGLAANEPQRVGQDADSQFVTGLGTRVTDTDADQRAKAEQEADEKEEKEEEAGEDKEEAREERKDEHGDDEDDRDGDAAEEEEEDDDADDDEEEDEEEEEEEKDEEDEAQEESEDRPETHTVETKDLKIEVALEGVFVASEMEEVPLRPETWTSFKVVEAVEHGARVRKGEVLVKFDDAKIEEALTDKSLAERLGELAMMEAEEELPRLEKTMELDWEAAKRQRQQTLEEFARFKEVMRPMSIKFAESNLKDAKQSLENAQEELDQLLKMYNADELTEETEEIVLKRQRHMVEYYELYYEYAQINRDYTINVAIPRRDESLDAMLKRSELNFERAKMSNSTGMTKQRYQMEKLREARARTIEQHAKLVSDRSLMTLRAPIDGYAYYGRCVNGRWTDITSMTTKLAPFGTVTANSVVMTIVQPRPLYVQSSVAEKDFADVKSGLKAAVSPTADGEVELTGKIDDVSTVPGSSNKFRVKLTVDLQDAPEWLMPGMTCKAKVTTYEAKEAVVIPASLVHTDDEDPEEKYVLLDVEDEDEPVRRDVKLGRKKDKEVEVLSGLNAGDKVIKDAKE